MAMDGTFFKEETDKYKYTHLADGLQFIPYGVAVDEFQHQVYENPEWTPSDRKKLGKSLRKSTFLIENMTIILT